MSVSQSCRFCHTMNRIDGPLVPFCSQCRHRADLPMSECDCAKCRRFEPPRDITGAPVTVGAVVEFDEEYHGFTGGRVAQLTRGILGTVAAVEVEPGRRVDTFCRRLRVVAQSSAGEHP